MHPKPLLIFLVLILSLSACRNEKDCVEPSDGQAFCGFGELSSGCGEGEGQNQIPGTLVNRTMGCRELDVPGTYGDDPATLWNLEIKGDCLELDVRFGGSHLNHPFFLVWDGTYLPGNVPTAKLRLFHDFGNDFGEAWLLRSVRRDLTALRHAGGNQVQIIVENYQGETLSALYEY